MILFVQCYNPSTAVQSGHKEAQLKSLLGNTKKQYKEMPFGIATKMLNSFFVMQIMGYFAVKLV